MTGRRVARVHSAGALDIRPEGRLLYEHVFPS